MTAKKGTAASKVVTELLRKITNKTVLGKEFLSVAPKEATKLYTIFGTISGYKADSGDFGDFVIFAGDFVAALESDKTKEFRAPKCIVPVPMDSVLVAMYDKAVADMADEDGELPIGKKAVCQFAVEIGYKPESTPTGYEWTVTPLIEMQPNDAISSLRSQLALENKG